MGYCVFSVLRSDIVFQTATLPTQNQLFNVHFASTLHINIWGIFPIYSKNTADTVAYPDGTEVPKSFPIPSLRGRHSTRVAPGTRARLKNRGLAWRSTGTAPLV